MAARGRHAGIITRTCVDVVIMWSSGLAADTFLRHATAARRNARARALESRTLLGHCKNALGYCLSGYCVYKMATAAKALVMGEDFSSDSVGRFLAAALLRAAHGRVTLQPAVAAQYVTLALVGALSALSIRGFMAQVGGQLVTV